MSGCAKPIDPSVATEDIRAKTDEMVEAWRNSDLEWMQRNIADDYLITTQTNAVTDRQAIFDYLAEAEPDPDPGTAAVEDWQAILAGDTVIAVYRTNWTFAEGGSNDVRVTDTWNRRDGAWQLVAQHISRISLVPTAATRARLEREVAEFIEACVSDPDVEASIRCLRDDAAVVTDILTATLTDRATGRQETARLSETHFLVKDGGDWRIISENMNDLTAD